VKALKSARINLLCWYYALKNCI